MLQLSRAARRPLRVRLSGPSPQSNSRLFSSLGQFPRPSSAPRLSASRHNYPLSRSLIGVRSFSIWPTSSKPTPPPEPVVEEPAAAATPAIEEPVAVDPPPSDVDTAPLSSFTEFPKTVPTEHASSIVDRWLPSVPELQEVVDHAPDTMGYLSALGLQNGWGPTTMMQNIIESIHVYTGAPWWATVLITVATIRIGFFPLFARLADNTARMKDVRPHLNPLMERQMQAFTMKDKVLQQQITAEMQLVYKKAGASPLLPIAGFFQIPFQIGSFFILRQMAYLPVPGLDTAGILWFTDLTSADPYFILPVVSSGLLFASLRFTVADALSPQSVKIMQYISYILPGISLAVTCTMPSILTLYFSATSLLAFLQNAAFRNAKIRAYLGIYPLSDPKLEANPLLETGNLSDAARSRLEADRAIVEAEREKMSSQSTSTNMVSRALGSKDGIVAGIKEQLQKNREDAKYTEYEKKAAELDKAKKRMGM
ncbi:Mitochondrial inner membrane protein oxa1 [Orbilia brochopaga]|uniref:Mitochondrial inner membrane protein oxa1 n=1 Tax=Orbilia brochopaga TaxID=3140254 RepID=A0AAV9URS8_9PEZI